MSIKKTVRATSLPGTHPGLMQKIRDAEQAELKGETPRSLDGAQKITRPAPSLVGVDDRIAQVRALGLVDPAYLIGDDGRFVLADQEAFKPGIDLDGIWDELTEGEKIRAGAVERFRLEIEANLERAAKPWQRPHELGGKLDARNLNRAQQNLEAEVAAYDHLLASDSQQLLGRFIDETRSIISTGMRDRAVGGIPAAPLYDILRDLIHKMVYQELVSRRRAMGDRGIRRIVANVDLAEAVYRLLGDKEDFSLRQSLLMRLIHVHQDLGYTAYAARVSYRGTRLHRAYGARIFTDELNRYRALFSHDELTLARAAVATHSSEELPFGEARVLALVRAVDHLAPFAPHRLFKHFEQIEGATGYLDAMLEGVSTHSVKTDGLPAIKEALRDHLDAQEVEPALRDDLMASFRPFERLADPIDLGDLAGEVGRIDYDFDESPGYLAATLKPDPFARKYQVLFDVQQDQLTRLARDTGVSMQALRTAPEVTFQVEGAGALILRRG